MEPTLLQGQNVLVSSMPFLFSKPKVGDIVVVKYSGHRHSGDQAKPETPESPPLPHGAKRFWTSQNDERDKLFIKRITKIDKERYFVSGDNKNDSLDSRRIGWILKKDIVGKVLLEL